MGVGMLGCACCPGCVEMSGPGFHVLYWDSLFEPDYDTAIDPPAGWCYWSGLGAWIEQTLVGSPASKIRHTDADTLTLDSTSQDTHGVFRCITCPTADHTLFLEADNLTANTNKFGLYLQFASILEVRVSDRGGVVDIYDGLQTIPGSTAGLSTGFTKIRIEFANTNIVITILPVDGNWTATADVRVRVWLDDVLEYDASYTGKQMRRCGAAAGPYFRSFGVTYVVNDYRSGVE